MPTTYKYYPAPAPPSLAELTMPRRSGTPELIADTAAGLSASLQHLRSSAGESLIRITGAGTLRPELMNRLLQTVCGALANTFDGMLLTGATRSVDQHSGDLRPGVTEVGARLERLCPTARVLGIVPTAELERSFGGRVTILRGDDLSVSLHPDNLTILSTTKRTPYFWDAEWQRALEVRRMALASRSVLLSFDGGPATEREIGAWATESRQDPSVHVILILGGSSSRTTDTVAGNSKLLREYPNIHVVKPFAHELQAKLEQIEILRERQSSVHRKAG